MREPVLLQIVVIGRFYCQACQRFSWTSVRPADLAVEEMRCPAGHVVVRSAGPDDLPHLGD